MLTFSQFIFRLTLWDAWQAIESRWKITKKFQLYLHEVTPSYSASGPVQWPLTFSRESFKMSLFLYSFSDLHLKEPDGVQPKQALGCQMTSFTITPVGFVRTQCCCVICWCMCVRFPLARAPVLDRAVSVSHGYRRQFLLLLRLDILCLIQTW